MSTSEVPDGKPTRRIRMPRWIVFILGLLVVLVVSAHGRCAAVGHFVAQTAFRLDRERPSNMESARAHPRRGWGRRARLGIWRNVRPVFQTA